MMTLKSMIIAYAALIISFVSISECDPLITGFTTDLIHREYSSQSPSYDPSLSHSQRTVNALRRSFDRVHRFKKLDSSSKQTALESAISGEYLMRYSVGTPPVPSIAVIDTTSYITWMQCQPCVLCFDQSLPLFQPSSSSTYKKIRCNTTGCNYLLNSASCSQDKKYCMYSLQYDDGSFTSGEFATETFTLASSDGGNASEPKVTFGCGFNNDGRFSSGESGVVALGGGIRSRISFVPQLGSSAEWKFSYCLGPSSENRSNSDELSFGSNAVVSGPGAVSTPLIEKPPSAFYYLTMEGISIGNQTLEFVYDIVIDIGSTVTMLPRDFYNKLEDAVKSLVPKTLLQIADPTGLLSLCYLVDMEAGVDVGIPDVTVHFLGADLKLKQDNIFVRTSDFTVCLAAIPTDDVAVYGNLAQRNFLVGYDLLKRTVSFMPSDCGK